VPPILSFPQWWTRSTDLKVEAYRSATIDPQAAVGSSGMFTFGELLFSRDHVDVDGGIDAAVCEAGYSAQLMPTDSCTIAAALPDIDCAMSSWGEWGECTEPCGGGTRSRSRSIVAEPVGAGAACPADLTESEDCKLATCDIDCIMSDFGEWSECTEPCGDGNIERERSIVAEPVGAGAACETLVEREVCSGQVVKAGQIST